MSEIELKFQIPEAFQDMIYQDFCASKVYKQRLLAHYYDTEDFQLAQQSIALRLRLEQGHWIQTLKYKTEQHIERFEFESDLGKKKQPKLNLGVYQDHFDELPTLLTTPDAAQNFQIKFSTDVERVSKILLFNQSEIEVCLDIGHLVFQNEKLRIFELEFELVQGTIHDLIRCIEPWMNKYQLWLDTRSKSQRGDLHLQQQDVLLPQYAEPILLDQEMTTNSAVQLILNNTFKHFLPNATALASGSYNSEHVHQARVAIRRMRSALKSYAHLVHNISPHWAAQLRIIFQSLGHARDTDAIRETLLPQLQQAGCTHLDIPNAENYHNQIMWIFQSVETNQLILELMDYMTSEPSLKNKKEKPFIKYAEKILKKTHQQIADDIGHFSQLEDEEKHMLRKRFKHLRYNIEFVRSLYRKKAVKHYLTAIKPIQELLGQYNDLLVAEQFFHELPENEEIICAIHWLKQQEKQQLKHVDKQLKAFRKIKPFWA